MTQAKNEYIKEYTLKSGKKLKLDLSPQNASGNTLYKCREMGGLKAVMYLISELGTFDGVKVPAPEILNWSMFEIMELEAIWAELEAEKK